VSLPPRAQAPVGIERSVSWAVLALAFRNREFDWRIPVGVAGVMLAVALILTYPPIFEAFAPD